MRRQLLLGSLADSVAFGRYAMNQTMRGNVDSIARSARGMSIGNGKLSAEFDGIQQVKDRNPEATKNSIAQFGREFPRSFQHVVYLGLGNPQYPREPAFGEISIRDPVIYKPDQPSSKRFEGDGFRPGK